VLLSKSVLILQTATVCQRTISHCLIQAKLYFFE